MSQKVKTVQCPNCHHNLVHLLHGTNGGMIIICEKCGSSVKINAGKKQISTDARVNHRAAVSPP